MNAPFRHCAPKSREAQLFPRLETTPDISRGDQRLAAEVALAEFSGEAIPGHAIHRAVRTLTVMAHG